MKSMESNKQVQVIESSFVAPREATPTKGLWLSPLDLAATRGHTPLVYLYRSGAAFIDVARLKEAMAKALVPFYPFAGRLGVNADGRVEISCNGEGALFVVARSSLVAEDVDFSRPSLQLRGMFVPRIEPSSLILATQVTFFKCGGVALGVAVQHAAVDGPSTFHFMQAWSAFSRNGDGAAATVELPCHDRTLLRARNPPIVHPGALAATCPRVALSDSPEPTVTEAFTISRAQLAALKRLCGGASTFCSVGALLWRCATTARQLPPSATVRLSFPANFRRRVRPPLPSGYFGNALISLCAASVVADVASEAAPLASVAARITGAVARMDDVLVRSAIDHLELAGMGIRPPRGSLPETEIRIVSWLGMPLHDADFGSGSPQVVSRADSVRGGFAHVMDDVPADAGVRVVMCMKAANMDEFKRLFYANIAHTSKL
ncbi:unnamed protein product [Urochloa decumbens]|uniref:Uncharacterized protein n=1 Tax=Urochloa decumbens TaxID=240449 RepID=A0ABC9FRR6_9POAL